MAPSVPLIIAMALLGTLAFPSSAQDSPQDYLDAHNQARAMVGVGPVTWNDPLVSYAQDYANQRAAGDCVLVHSHGPYGENLAGGSGGALSGKDSVAMWVSEKVDYDYNTNTCAPGKVCGHYTQVVWRSSTNIGCAKAACSGDPQSSFVICSYSPPGNYVGEKPY
ncbi:Pathogenesis-related protein 1 [Linum grandiflorum]